MIKSGIEKCIAFWYNDYTSDTLLERGDYVGFISDPDINISFNHWKSVSMMPYTHVHRHYELYFCSDDVRQVSTINGTEYIYKFPCAIFSSPYTVHSMSCTETETDSFERYVFSIDSVTFESIIPFLPPIFSENNVGLLFELDCNQASELKEFIDCSSAINKSTALNEQKLMFALILNKLFAYCEDKKITQVGKSSFYIQNVLQYIAENFHENHDANELALSFAVSRSKLDRDFKNATGVTVHQFVEMCRVNHAKILLSKHTDLPIERIAASVGIDSVKYFFSFFKRHVGMTPMEYRNSLKSKNKK